MQRGKAVIEFIPQNSHVIELSGKRGIVYWLQGSIRKYDNGMLVDALPHGFLTDGFSIPPLLYGTIRGLKSRIPAYFHDMEYALGRKRSQADLNLFLANVAVGNGVYNALKIHAALMAFGWIAHNKHERRLAEAGYDPLKSRIATEIGQAEKLAKDL